MKTKQLPQFIILTRNLRKQRDKMCLDQLKFACVTKPKGRKIIFFRTRYINPAPGLAINDAMLWFWWRETRNLKRKGTTKKLRKEIEMRMNE